MTLTVGIEFEFSRKQKIEPSAAIKVEWELEGLVIRFRDTGCTTLKELLAYLLSLLSTLCTTCGCKRLA